MGDPITIQAEIDLDSIKETIEEAKDLNNNKEIFERLVEFARIKKQASDILDQIASIETDVKGFIKAKASALYGAEWDAIKGEGYKITQSPTGALFSINGHPPKKFLIVRESVDSKAVETYVKEKGKLPSGLEYNPSRGSSIRINVQDNNG